MERVLAVLSLIFGLLSLLCCCVPYGGITLAVLGLIMGIFSLIKIINDPILNMENTYKGIAIAGIVISIVGFFAGLILNILFIWGSFDPEEIVDSYELTNPNFDFNQL